MRRYYAVGDRDDLTYEEKLAEYRAMVDEHFEVERYTEFCARSLPAARELSLEYFDGPAFDGLLIDSVKATFPAHEHEAMVARHRGLIGAWVQDQQPAR
jgi:hypothetical protein